MTSQITAELVKLQAQASSLLKQKDMAERQALIDYDQSGKVPDLKFFKSLAKHLLPENTIIDHEVDDGCEIFWFDNGYSCIVKYKGKWIVESDGFSKLDDCEDVYDTRIDAFGHVCRDFADRQTYNIREKLLNSILYED